MSKKIWIRLRPVNQYYFGGEVSFYSDSEKNYLVESRLFPQQTAVLGLLRYVLLREKDMLTNQQHLFNGKPEKDVEDLIGKKSFDMSELEKEQDFGIIKEISPLFLQREGYAWLPLAKDAGFDFKKENQGNCDLLGKKEERIPFLVGYKAKEGYTQQFSNGKDTPLSTESIFIKTTQIGIKKTGGDDAFYKQAFYRLSEGFEFGCIATLSKEIDLPTQSIIRFGGDQSYFFVHIESEETNFPQNLPPQYKEEDKQVGTRLTLLSDAYISNTLLKNCHLVFCETQDARFLQTSSSTTQPNNMSIDRKNPKAAYKTKRYSVLERGSVLYVKNLKEVINELDKTRLKQIGYNYYIIE